MLSCCPPAVLLGSPAVLLGSPAILLGPPAVLLGSSVVLLLCSQGSLPLSLLSFPPPGPVLSSSVPRGRRNPPHVSGILESL